MSALDILDNIPENMCMSGGAEGADLQWGMMAGRNGHSVIHWSFDGHRTEAPDVEVVRLNETLLLEADDYVKLANKSLKRKFPSKSEHVNNLLRRNYYQVRWSDAVYGVGVMKDGKVQGGTAWAIQMYLDRFIHGDEHFDDCKCYFYDQTTNAWFQYILNKWVGLEGEPPKPHGIWAGVGSRDLTHDGKWAIRNLLGGFIVPNP